MSASRLADGRAVARAALLTLLWAVCALTVATVVLFSQPAVAGIAKYVHGDSPDRAVLLESAEQTRRYTVGVESQVTFDPTGINGLDAGALDHLLDVRAIVRLAELLMYAALALAAVVVVASTLGRVKLDELAASLRWAGAGIGATVVAAGVVVAVGFDWFFVTFHHLLFAEGTWTFSVESLLIRTFPELFWIAAAVGWLAAVVVLAVAMLGASVGVSTVAARRHGEDSLVP